MERPLLVGQSSNNNARHGDRDNHDNRKGYSRISDAIAYGDPYQKAAALVDLAEDGIGLPEQVLDESGFANAAKFYFMFMRFDILWNLNLFALIALNFFEKPLWCAKYTTNSCSNRDYFFLGQLPYLASGESLVYEGVTLFILVVHTFFPVAYEGHRLYWKNPLNNLKVIFLVILVCDILVYAIYLSPVGLSSLSLRIAPYVRVIFVILSVRGLRGCMAILAGMIEVYLNVLVLGLLFLLICSWLAYVMFMDTILGKTTFYSFGATLYQMLVLFTMNNDPDLWIPAYK
ncbi:hypothetical protein GIB67_039159 [Kingdonia uniflora]|uniref:Ion transport domain-containing protein n=1 Tax=Kingdonia uniflora TaxID=39325 RepID=A0A7J7MM93_9MAGN|nr:hypothetical protein GIB67_039159 [Kingdonia uniflora]